MEIILLSVVILIAGIPPLVATIDYLKDLKEHASLAVVLSGIGFSLFCFGVGIYGIFFSYHLIWIIANIRKEQTNMNTNYRLLRNIYKSFDMNSQSDLDEVLEYKIGKSTIDKKFAGKSEWTREQMYQILNFFNVPKKYLADVFPDDISETPRITVKDIYAEV